MTLDGIDPSIGLQTGKCIIPLSCVPLEGGDVAAAE